MPEHSIHPRLPEGTERVVSTGIERLPDGGMILTLLTVGPLPLELIQYRMFLDRYLTWSLLRALARDEATCREVAERHRDGHDARAIRRPVGGQGDVPKLRHGVAGVSDHGPFHHREHVVAVSAARLSVHRFALHDRIPAHPYPHVGTGPHGLRNGSLISADRVCKRLCCVRCGLDPRKIKPWTRDRVVAVRAGLPEQYATTVDLGAGCGLRQGEIFGLAVDEVDFDGGVLHIARQVKLVGPQMVFAPPKGGKLRDVPLPDVVSDALAAHVTRRPPIDVTLPWKTPDGPPVTVKLLFYSRERKALNRNYFNMYLWKPALIAGGVIPERVPGERFKPSREHGMHALRHYYASVLLDSGENIKALAEYLGHSDPGFTLRTYTHLMPNSRDRARRAIDSVFGKGVSP
ncbi:MULTISPECIES: tyrosine-type recombinase/integrase [Streptomyces]|uniref:Tyrosine-type recombinase/integrase n=2 Tax=Streptomyces TaxID=1883 RepID=A0ABV9J0P3_9ACTN